MEVDGGEGMREERREDRGKRAVGFPSRYMPSYGSLQTNFFRVQPPIFSENLPEIYCRTFFRKELERIPSKNPHTQRYYFGHR